jgi:hypothetical protein
LVPELLHVGTGGPADSSSFESSASRLLVQIEGSCNSNRIRRGRFHIAKGCLCGLARVLQSIHPQHLLTLHILDFLARHLRLTHCRSPCLHFLLVNVGDILGPLSANFQPSLHFFLLNGSNSLLLLLPLSLGRLAPGANDILRPSSLDALRITLLHEID